LLGTAKASCSVLAGSSTARILKNIAMPQLRWKQALAIAMKGLLRMMRSTLPVNHPARWLIDPAKICLNPVTMAKSGIQTRRHATTWLQEFNLHLAGSIGELLRGPAAMLHGELLQGPNPSRWMTVDPNASRARVSTKVCFGGRAARWPLRVLLKTPWIP
jgi:hypothetical protein